MEKVSHKLEEDMCDRYIWQSTDTQNIQRTPTSQWKKDKQHNRTIHKRVGTSKERLSMQPIDIQTVHSIIKHQGNAS